MQVASDKAVAGGGDWHGRAQGYPRCHRGWRGPQSPAGSQQEWHRPGSGGCLLAGVRYRAAGPHWLFAWVWLFGAIRYLILCCFQSLQQRFGPDCSCDIQNRQVIVQLSPNFQCASVLTNMCNSLRKYLWSLDYLCHNGVAIHGASIILMGELCVRHLQARCPLKQMALYLWARVGALLATPLLWTDFRNQALLLGKAPPSLSSWSLISGTSYKETLQR